MTSTIKSKFSSLTCYHCGTSITDIIILEDEKNFCCQGCVSVFSILKENNLCDYYDFNQSPGIKLNKAGVEHEFSCLDEDDIFRKTIKFKEGNTAVVLFDIPTIHCSSCIYLLEHLPRLQKGIASSQVNFGAKTLLVQWDLSVLKLSELAILLEKIGYKPRLNLESIEENKPLIANEKNALIKIGIAGFCFGNIMLLSLPEYLGYSWQSDAYLHRIFDLLNFILALPVFFFCSWGFFKNAIAGLKVKEVNIDVPIALGILVMFVRSVIEVGFQFGPGYFDTMGGLVFFMLTGRFFQDKTYTAIGFDHTYRSFFPIAASVLDEDGVENQIEIAKLKPGHCILVRTGGLIPADSVLTKGIAEIDYSFVTGESAPKILSPGKLVYGGGRHTGQAIELVIQKEVSQGYLTSLWNRQKNKTLDAVPFEKTVDFISRYFTLAILALAIGAGLYWFRTDLSRAINAFTAVLIIACPCALALSSPFTLGNIMRILGKEGFFLKNARVIETLNKADYMVFDKTGTITQQGELRPNYLGNSISEIDLSVYELMLKNSAHPLSKAIYAEIGQLKTSNDVVIADFQELNGLGLSASFGESNYKIGSAFFVGLTKGMGNKHGTITYLAKDGIVIGQYTFSNSYRSGLSEVIANLVKHQKLAVLSGDNSSEAQHLRVVFPIGSTLLFDQSPSEKASFIESRQKLGHNVVMLGDGLNDAGALMQANTGVAVSENAGHFSPACDAVLLSSSFDKFHKFMAFVRWAPPIIYSSFIISLGYNAVGLYYALPGNMNPVVAAIIMPISSITIVVFTMLSSRLAARLTIRKRTD